MGYRSYPVLRCTECGDDTRLVAICEKPGEGTETRFYECSNPRCRDSFRASVPNLRAEGWIGVRRDAERLRKTLN